MGFILKYDRSWKRVRKNGVLTPYFKYKMQALKYLQSELGDSPYIDIYEVR